MNSETDGTRPARPAAGRKRDRFSLRDLMILIAGLGVGFWMILPDVKGDGTQVTSIGDLGDVALLASTGLLGGLSLVGVPLLLSERRRRGPAWGAGKVLWFSSGTAAWLLWPPVVVKRAQGGVFGNTTSGVCFAYGTPLMALYVTAALLAGGWLRGRRRKRLRRSWREQFGLALGALWACTGIYLVYIFYYEDLSK